MDAVGSLSHGNVITADQTYILAGYTIPCNATVIAWEFCYQIRDAMPMTFYPGIWRVTKIKVMQGKDKTDYELVQSTTITFNSSDSSSNKISCSTVNLTETDQFTVHKGSVVGLYSNNATLLSYTNTESSVGTYQYKGNKTSVENAFLGNKKDIKSNVTIRVHLGKCRGEIIFI